MTDRVTELLERLVAQNDEIIGLLEQQGSVGIVRLLKDQDKETRLAFAYGLLNHDRRGRVAVGTGGFGRRKDFQGGSRILASSRHWRSLTPFLAPGHLKKAGHAAAGTQLPPFPQSAPRASTRLVGSIAGNRVSGGSPGTAGPRVREPLRLVNVRGVVGVTSSGS